MPVGSQGVSTLRPAGRLAELATREALSGLGVYIALTVAWPLAMLADVGFNAWRESIGERRIFSRFGGPLHYLQTLPIRLAPWTLLLPALVLTSPSFLRGTTATGLRLPLAWFGVIVVLLHLTSAKHSRYLLPAFPAIALILIAICIEPGTGLTAKLTRRARQWRDGALGVVLGLSMPAGAILCLVPMLAPEGRRVWPALLIAGALTLWWSGVGLRALRATGDATAARCWL
jgi:hypothetical protein